MNQQQEGASWWRGVSKGAQVRSSLDTPRVAKEDPEEPQRPMRLSWNSGPFSHVKLWGHDPVDNERVVSRGQTDPILSLANPVVDLWRRDWKGGA